MPAIAISLDVYPAKVMLPSGAEIAKARVIIADGHLYLYVTQNGQPFLYYDKAVMSTQGRTPLAGMKVIVDDGVISVKKSGGCGCGDKLKSWNPWPGRPRARVAL